MNDLKFEILKKFGTQFVFAREVGDHFSFVSMVLNGHRVLSDEKARRWGKALGVSPEIIKPFMDKKIF
jgi:plasmid maintenance system antidote protein VapI